MKIDLDGLENITQEIFKECNEYIDSFVNNDTDVLWLTNKTEQWCQDRALENALRESTRIAFIDKENGGIARGSIPKVLSDALAVSFDTDVGHDYLEQSDERFNYYHERRKQIPFHIDLLNKITQGGVFPGTLNMVMAGTGVGKSIFLADCAAFNLQQGMNVAYITLEMSAEEIARRIDANLLDIHINDFNLVIKSVYDKKINKLKESTKGKLLLKWYPTVSATVNHFRYFLNECKMKKGIKPDIVYIDYINLCLSSRFQTIKDSYSYIKAIAEELRGLAGEFDIPIWSATQVNREGFKSSDFGLEHTAESFGLPATADLFLALIQTEASKELDQIKIKQLKNRYNDVTFWNKFTVGVDKSRMRMYNVVQHTEKEKEEVPNEDKETKKFDKSIFNDFL